MRAYTQGGMGGACAPHLQFYEKIEGAPYTRLHAPTPARAHPFNLRKKLTGPAG